MSKVIILSGPTNCGKDTIARTIESYAGFHHMQFKGLMFDVAMAITGLDSDEFFTIYNDRSLKEKPHPKFKYMSPRGMMIWISDTVLMPQFGADCMGVHAASRLNLEDGTVFSDGFMWPEINPVCDVAGADNVLIVRVYRDGCEFGTGGDRRRYILEDEVPKGVKFLDLDNNGDIDDSVMDILLHMGELWNI